MRVTVLGTGTSTGVPLPGCRCEVCLSAEPKNKRLRTSIFVEIIESDVLSGGSTDVVGSIVVDTGPDFRAQALRANISRVDAVLYTHTHADHIFGLDDLRCYNFLGQPSIPLYASVKASQRIKKLFDYAFTENKNYEGGAPPKLTLDVIEAYQAFQLFGYEILPLLLYHGSGEVLGFRFGDFAYLTDCNLIPDESRDNLAGLKVLILDGLRKRPHKTHFNHEQAVREIEKLRPEKTYLTHVTHDIDHYTTNQELSSMTELAVELAYDELVLEF